jgi:hypothetical protein
MFGFIGGAIGDAISGGMDLVGLGGDEKGGDCKCEDKDNGGDAVGNVVGDALSGNIPGAALGALGAAGEGFLSLFGGGDDGKKDENEDGFQSLPDWIS